MLSLLSDFGVFGKAVVLVFEGSLKDQEKILFTKFLFKITVRISTVGENTGVIAYISWYPQGILKVLA